MLLAFVLAVCWLTLRPQWSAYTSGAVVENAASDFFRNTFLLAPLGLLLAINGLRTRHVALASLAFATAIEVFQVFIPGRFSSPTDVVANALGSSMGAWLWYQRWRLRHPPLGAAFVVAACTFVVPVLAGLSFRPALPIDQNWRAVFTPDLDIRYKGRVLEAHLGDNPLRPGRHLPREQLVAMLATTIDLSATIIASAPPSRRAVIIRLHDEADRELAELAIQGTDVVFRVRTWSKALRFDEPVLRWRGILGGVRAADTIQVRITRRGDETCLSVQARETCKAARLRETWMAVAPERSVSARTAKLAGWLFLAALVVPIGLVARTRAGATACAMTVAGFAVLPPLVGLAPMSLADWGAATCGLLLGIALRAFLLSPYAPRTLGAEPSGAP